MGHDAGLSSLQQMLDGMFGGRRVAEISPTRNKHSRMMPKGANYVYTPCGKDGLGRTVWFCRSTQKNAAGYYLTWREVRGKSGGKRDMWVSHAHRKSAKARCARMAAKIKAKRSSCGKIL